MEKIFVLGGFINDLMSVLKNYASQIFIASFFTYLVFCLLKYVFADFFAKVLFQVEDKNKPVIDEATGNAVVINGKVQYEKRDKKVNSLIPLFTWFCASVIFLFLVKYNVSKAMTCGLCISLLSSCMDNILCVFRNLIQSLIAFVKFLVSKVRKDRDNTDDAGERPVVKTKDDITIELLREILNQTKNGNVTSSSNVVSNG